jgi:hypothetical protein
VLSQGAIIDRWVLCSSTVGSGAGQEDEKTFVKMDLIVAVMYKSEQVLEGNVGWIVIG